MTPCVFSRRMVDEATVRETAIEYAELELYDPVEVAFVGMTDAPNGTRVGLKVQLKEGSLFGGFLGSLLGLVLGLIVSLPFVFIFPPLVALLAPAGLLGGAYVAYYGTAPTEYATVTVDDAGDVVMSNQDYEEGDFDDALDRNVSAQGAQARLEADARRRATAGLSASEAVDLFFGSDDEFSEPDSCPECGAKNTLMSPQFAELAPGRYQCEDCGNIVNLAGSD